MMRNSYIEILANPRSKHDLQPIKATEFDLNVHSTHQEVLSIKDDQIISRNETISNDRLNDEYLSYCRCFDRC